MNPDSPQSPREELEARLTALLLDELPPEEAASLQQALAQDAELARLHHRLKQAIELVRETVATPEEETATPSEALQLAPERRASLLASFKTPPAKVVRVSSWSPARRRELLALAAMIVALLVVGGIVVVNLDNPSEPLEAVREKFVFAWSGQKKLENTTPLPGVGVQDSDLDGRPELNLYAVDSEPRATTQPAGQTITVVPDRLIDAALGGSSFRDARQDALAVGKDALPRGAIAFDAVTGVAGGAPVQNAESAGTAGRRLQRIALPSLDETSLRVIEDLSGPSLAGSFFHDTRPQPVNEFGSSTPAAPVTGGQGGGAGLSRGSQIAQNVDRPESLERLALNIKGADPLKDVQFEGDFTKIEPGLQKGLSEDVGRPAARAGAQPASAVDTTAGSPAGSTAGKPELSFRLRSPGPVSGNPTLPAPHLGVASGQFAAAGLGDSDGKAPADLFFKSDAAVRSANGAVAAVPPPPPSAVPVPQRLPPITAATSDGEVVQRADGFAYGVTAGFAMVGTNAIMADPAYSAEAAPSQSGFGDRFRSIVSRAASGELDMSGVAAGDKKANKLEEQSWGGRAAADSQSLAVSVTLAETVNTPLGGEEKLAEVSKSKQGGVYSVNAVGHSNVKVESPKAETQLNLGRLSGPESSEAKPADVALSASQRRVEIALPAGGRGNASEKLELGTLSTASDPSTGLPPTERPRTLADFKPPVKSVPVSDEVRQSVRLWLDGAAQSPELGIQQEKQPDPSSTVAASVSGVQPQSQQPPADRLAKLSDAAKREGKEAKGSGPSSGESPQSTPTEITQLTRELDTLRSTRAKIYNRAMQEKAAAAIPKSGIVEIIDRAEAEPAQKPSLWGRLAGAFTGEPERSVRIAIEKEVSDVQGLSDGNTSSGFDPYWIQTQGEKIQSKAVLGQVIEKLNLNEAWARRHAGGDKLSTDDAYRLLKEKTDVSSVPKTGLMEIRVKGESADEAARIANAIAEVYREQRQNRQEQLHLRGAQVLEEEVVKQEKEIARIEQELEKRKKAINPEQAARGLPLHLQFDEANLSQVLEKYQQLTDRTVLKPNSLPPAKVTINSQAPLTRKEALQALDGVLALNQITMTPQGEKFTKAVIPAQAFTEAGRFNMAPRGDLPESGGLTTTIYKLTNASPDDVARAIQPLAKMPNSVLTIPGSGILIVRDFAANAKQMEQLVKRLETDAKVEPKRDEEMPPKKLAAGAPTPQPEITVAENAFSTFSLNVSDVSFKLAAAALEKGQMPDPATVRSEEFINAFDYRDPEPKGSAPIAFAWERARYPFAHDRDLVRFSIKTAASGRQPGRPLNLVLLLDNSGSMERADRIRIRQECLRVLAGQLQPQDRVSVVAFARTARLWVDGLPGNQAGELPQRVGSLAPEGGTNLEDAMNLAYQTALRHFLVHGVNRVVLLTDGAANLGDVEPESLKKKVEAHRQQGVALDCFGIGWEGLNDELLETLSRNGDGRYGFVNTHEAATTEFAGQLAGALQVAASDVKVQVEWNPRRVTAYRQIGYAKHQLKKEQFRDNTVDAAEIGAAEAGNALYAVQVNPAGEGPLGTMRVRFKVPGTTDYREHEWTLSYDGGAKALAQSSPALRLAATASAFSEWLVSSPFAAEVTPDRLLNTFGGVQEAFTADPRPKKLEWMIRQAKSVTGK